MVNGTYLLVPTKTSLPSETERPPSRRSLRNPIRCFDQAIYGRADGRYGSIALLLVNAPCLCTSASPRKQTQSLTTGICREGPKTDSCSATFFTRHWITSWARGSGASASRFDPDQKKAAIFFWPKAVVFRAVDHSSFASVSNEEDAAMAENITRIRCVVNHFTARSSG